MWGQAAAQRVILRPPFVICSHRAHPRLCGPGAAGRQTGPAHWHALGAWPVGVVEMYNVQRTLVKHQHKKSEFPTLCLFPPLVNTPP